MKKQNQTKPDDTNEKPARNAATTMMLPIANIIALPELQMRADGLDADHVEALVEALDGGAELAPVEVYYDEENERHLLADGFHRHAAYQKVASETRTEMPVIVRLGGLRAAMERALSANAEHTALRRTNADKRKAVETALELYPDLSNVKIAELCKVTHQSVAKIRKPTKGGSTVESGIVPSFKGKEPVNPQMELWTDWQDEFTKLDAYLLAPEHIELLDKQQVTALRDELAARVKMLSDYIKGGVTPKPAPKA